jgi:poly(3-hydroxybutyrate) depolymerase
MLRPFLTSAGRRPIRARITPSQTAAASSKPVPTGLCASAALWPMHTYSACAPNVQALTPKTSSPTVNSVTAGPAASTTPASSVPRIRCRGRRRPVTRRAAGGVPARVSVSDRLTVVARILIRTWSGPGTGRSTSTSRSTSGGP